jgi:hypothetical protein
MQKHHHRVLRSGKTLMAMAALVLLVSAVSHAQVSLDQLTKQPVVVDAGKKEKEKEKDGKKPVSVPEPSASVLLLLGFGMTGLVGYAVERRKRWA